ncbi:MAG: SLC13 family permease, partial [Planctomycetaceae bacterium]
MAEHSADERQREHLTRGDRKRQLGGLLIATAAFVAIIMIPTPTGLSPAAHTLAATTVLMAVLWVSQAIPIAATALIPLAAYPLLGIQPAETVSRSYMNANIFLFFGGFIVALGIERWGLHRRMALHVVHRIGGSPRRIVLGFMMATAFLSMWISNTATTMLMLPIAMALLRTLEDVGVAPEADSAERDQSHRALARLGVALMLGIAYSASCGGFATLVGTPTNIAFMGQWRSLFPDAPEPSMAEWIVVFLPLTVLMLAAAFAQLTWKLPRQIGSAQIGRSFFGERLRALGRPSAGEWTMLVLFAMTAALWISREPVEFQIAGREEPLTLVRGWSPAYERFLVDRFGADPSAAQGAVHDA